MSITHKFILAILTVVFLIVGLFTYGSVKEQKRILNFELEKRVKLMQDNLIQNATYTMAYYKNEIENDLASMNLSHIQLLFTQLVKRENIDGISLSNNLQSVQIFEGITSKKDVDKLSFEETQTHIIVSTPIILSSKWGNLNIVYSLKELNDEIESAQKDIQKFIDERIRDAVVSAIIFSLFFGVLSYALAVTITKPILLLTKRADQIANGKLEESKEILHINSNDEVGILTKSFMQMSQKLQKSYKDLKNINLSLENRIQKEVDKNRIQDQKLIQQSKMALMGELMSMIAHQWRQPLNIISLNTVKLETRALLEGNISNDEVFVIASEINKQSQYLSNTIDDFRHFYKPNKEMESVTLQDVVLRSLSIIKASFIDSGIKIVEEYDSKESLEIYYNEMVQVILNILKNAQDSFEKNNIKVPYINITTKNRTISICDNGGGISEDIKDKIFEPYFSTKEEKSVTGLGLYMSKTIVEKHHAGIIRVENKSNGTCIIIEI
ncbi:ATP-binding protein [Sulfurimonas sp.]